VVGGIGEHIGGNAGAHQLLQPTWTSSSVSGAEVAPSLTLGEEIDVDIWSNLLGQRFWDSSWHSAKPRSGMQEVLHLLQKREKLGAALKGSTGSNRSARYDNGQDAIHPSIHACQNRIWPMACLRPHPHASSVTTYDASDRTTIMRVLSSMLCTLRAFCTACVNWKRALAWSVTQKSIFWS